MYRYVNNTHYKDSKPQLLMNVYDFTQLEGSCSFVSTVGKKTLFYVHVFIAVVTLWSW